MKILTLSILSFTAVCVTVGAQDTAAPAASTVQADKQFLQQLEHTDQLGQNPLQGVDAPAAAPAANQTQPKSAPLAKKAAPARRTNDSAAVTAADQSAAPVAQERPQAEIRPVDKKWKRNVNAKTTAAATEKVEPADERIETRSVEKKSRREVNAKGTATTAGQVVPIDQNNEEAVDARPPRKGNRERPSRNNTLDPFNEAGGAAPARTETRSSRTYTNSQQVPAEVATGPQRTVTVTRTITALPDPQPAPREHDDENGFFHRLFHPKDRSGD
jgi:hypothetical protein